MQETPANSSTPEASDSRKKRLLSIDAFRGIVMFLMLAEVLHLGHLAEAFPDNKIASWFAFHQSHVEWRGCSIHDLIQPGFTFLVGTALAFSIASRKARSQSRLRLVLHAGWRAIVLVLLGVFLRSFSREQTYWTFEDTLTQIGLGYLPLVIIALLPRWCTWGSIAALLIGYFSLFALSPLPAEDFNLETVGVSQDWEHNESGFAAHWNKNVNAASRFDQSFLNLFPREEKFEFNSGGYSTLSFIPTLATMLLGLIAGHWLQADREKTKLNLLRFGGMIFGCLAIGYLLDGFGICPSVKRIWTPAWVLVSGGWCFLILLMLHWITDQFEIQKPFFPWVVIGMNSITAYVLSWILPDFIRVNLDRHLGSEFVLLVGEEFSFLLRGIIILTIIWLILFWMYRRRLFLKI